MWDVIFRRWLDLLFWWAPKKEGRPSPTRPEPTRTPEPSARPAPEPSARRPAEPSPRPAAKPSPAEPAGGGAPGATAPSARPAPEPAAAQAEKTVAPAVPDDLTVIKGIGPAMQNKLRALGITTFADLAAADPDALLRQLKGAQPLSKGRVSEWTRVARQRAQT